MHKAISEMKRALPVLERVEDIIVREYGIRRMGHQACNVEVGKITLISSEVSAESVEWGVLSLEWMVEMDFDDRDGGTQVVVALIFEPEDATLGIAQILVHMRTETGVWEIEHDELENSAEARRVAEMVPSGVVPEELAHEAIRFLAGHFVGHTRRQHCDA